MGGGGWREAEEEKVESLKRKTGEIDFIERTLARNGHSWEEDKKSVCGLPFAHRSTGAVK